MQCPEQGARPRASRGPSGCRGLPRDSAPPPRGALHASSPSRLLPFPLVLGSSFAATGAWTPRGCGFRLLLSLAERREPARAAQPGAVEEDAGRGPDGRRSAQQRERRALGRRSSRVGGSDLGASPQVPRQLGSRRCRLGAGWGLRSGLQPLALEAQGRAAGPRASQRLELASSCSQEKLRKRAWFQGSAGTVETLLASSTAWKSHHLGSLRLGGELTAG
ncbi:PREDICTED: ankyrin repeat domain-containing protein 34B isoform X3 [Rhinopithecus bieti]|uniref:ankyrin repeat domain-containing protein 34B isoform X3 n=1 Tax=Rhinopithecus bieti TaxID=61621 RepID=UPI00083BFFEB|nr:PREDICTED: ankyrin repeat domain-containing protein 34B isoform X3 [Rhinopithecus bieti]